MSVLWPFTYCVYVALRAVPVQPPTCKESEGGMEAGPFSEVMRNSLFLVSFLTTLVVDVEVEVEVEVESWWETCHTPVIHTVAHSSRSMQVCGR